MEATRPWDLFPSLIRSVFRQPSAKGGRPLFPLEVMLQIHVLQQWFNLSDPLMEEMLIDGRIPAETAILNFKHLLEAHQIAGQVFENLIHS